MSRAESKFFSQQRELREENKRLMEENRLINRSIPRYSNIRSVSIDDLKASTRGNTYRLPYEMDAGYKDMMR